MKKVVQLAVALCAMATAFGEDIFVKIDGISGGSVRKGLEGQIQAFAFSHEIVSPRDTASGQATGKRQHTPVRFVFPQEKSTPLLYKSLTQNTVIPSIVVSFFRTNVQGAEELYYKYELKNASIVTVRSWNPNQKDASVSNYGTQVEVGCVYQSIVWTYTTGGVTHEDSWETQR